MAAGEFSHAQQLRLQRAVANAEEQTGLQFRICVGRLRDRAEAERLLVGLAPDPRRGVVLLAVDPQSRRLEIVTTPEARRRLEDTACGLASLTMTASFAVGDLAGGLVSGLRMLADTAGRGLIVS